MIRKFAVIAVIFLAGFAPLAWGTEPQYPPTGSWGGSWGYMIGNNQFKQIHFRLFITESGKKLRGTYSNEQGKASKVDFVEISDDRKSYRMNVAGDCWYITVDGDEFSAARNGGKCTKVGLGSGARIETIGATRTSSR